MIKFPSASAGGTAPSGSSLAATYPAVSGSRAGGVGRGGRAGVAFDIWPIAGCISIVKLKTAHSTAARYVIVVIFILDWSSRTAMRVTSQDGLPSPGSYSYRRIGR